MRFAVSLERYSEHPLVSAMLEKAKEMRLRLSKPKDFKYHSGEGIVGRIDEDIIAVGNEKLMKKLKIEHPFQDGKDKKHVGRIWKICNVCCKKWEDNRTYSNPGPGARRRG